MAQRKTDLFSIRGQFQAPIPLKGGNCLPPANQKAILLRMRPRSLNIQRLWESPRSFNSPPQERTDTFAPLPNDAFAPGMEVPVDRWIFGQHNKLLPVKANLRALANLLRSESNSAGLPLDRASTEIAAAAVGLGDLVAAARLQYSTSARRIARCSLPKLRSSQQRQIEAAIRQPICWGNITRGTDDGPAYRSEIDQSRPL